MTSDSFTWPSGPSGPSGSSGSSGPAWCRRDQPGGQDTVVVKLLPGLSATPSTTNIKLASSTARVT